MQEVEVGLQEVLSPPVRPVNEVLHLLVDDVGGLPRVVRVLAGLCAEEAWAPTTTIADLPELIAEAHLSDHHLGRPGDLLEVPAGAGGDVLSAEDELLRDPSAQRNAHLVLQVASAVQAALQPLLAWGEEGEPSGSSPWHDADLGDRVVLWHESANNGVAGLVVRNQLPLLVRHDGILLLRASDDPLQGVGDLLLGDLLQGPPGGHDGSLVHQVLQVSAREAWSPPGDLLQVNVLGQDLVPGVDLEDLDPALDVGPVHGDLPVEPSRPEQGRVKDVGPVGGRHDDDSGVALKPVHLGQQLVERLLPLVVASANASSPGPSHRVDLVNEDDARGVLLGLLEKVPHTGGSHSDEHLDKLGSRDGEERHAGLTRDGLGQQSLSGSGRADEEDTLGDPGAHGGELLGPLQELHDLHEVVLGLIHSSDIVKHDARVWLHLELGLGLGEAEGVARSAAPRSAAAIPPAQEEEPSDENEREGEVAEERKEDGGPVLLWSVRREVDLLLLKLPQELLRGTGELHANPLNSVSDLRGNGLDNGGRAVVVQVHLLDAVEVKVLKKPGVRHARGRDGLVVGGHGVLLHSLQRPESSRRPKGQLLDEVSLALARDALVVVVVAVACPAARLHADGESRGAPPQGGPRLGGGGLLGSHAHHGLRHACSCLCVRTISPPTVFRGPGL
mmetsp:Transcript_2441/g.8243  ORF Transcript_2441/g.8243 Transcript_2441/m.8243 type:complete len:673 (+) Transcript_2441:1388-3406(+)